MPTLRVLAQTVNGAEISIAQSTRKSTRRTTGVRRLVVGVQASACPDSGSLVHCIRGSCSSRRPSSLKAELQRRRAAGVSRLVRCKRLGRRAGFPNCRMRSPHIRDVPPSFPTPLPRGERGGRAFGLRHSSFFRHSDFVLRHSAPGDSRPPLARMICDSVIARTRSVRTSVPHAERGNESYAKISCTISPCTSVRRKSRPAKR